MSTNKNIFGLALGAVLAVGCMETSWAAPEDSENVAEEVLFKVHDIVPVKNSDGEVVACDFNTTFYNRSPLEINQAELELVWTDASLENIIKDEKKADANKRNRNVNRAYSETERKTSKVVDAVVELSGLKSYKQVTINNRINTDRCFLLLQNVDFSMKSCSATGAATSVRGNARRSGRDACARMFKFVAPSDAQYYLDFKEISLDEEKTREEAQNLEKQNKSDALYSQTIDALNAANGIINEIK